MPKSRGNINRVVVWGTWVTWLGFFPVSHEVPQPPNKDHLSGKPLAVAPWLWTKPLWCYAPITVGPGCLYALPVTIYWSLLVLCLLSATNYRLQSWQSPPNPTNNMNSLHFSTTRSDARKLMNKSSLALEWGSDLGIKKWGCCQTRHNSLVSEGKPFYCRLYPTTFLSDWFLYPILITGHLCLV